METLRGKRGRKKSQVLICLNDGGARMQQWHAMNVTMRHDNEVRKALRDPTEHSLLEDAYAMLTGCTLAALGLVLMKTAGITTAGVAGIALLASYHLPLGVGLLFFLLNLPFLALGLRVLGRAFLLRTTIAVILVFALASLAHASLDITWVHPAFAALAGGTASGVGILALVRHNIGVGGVNIVALWAQKRRGWNVGKLHLVLDGAILIAAAATLSLDQWIWSMISMLAINMVLVAYHKPGRYVGH